MSEFLKKGWQPKGKEGGKESWRGDFKGIGQVAGWMGKGKKPGEGAGESAHVSRPLATLKDPTLFGPPPKNVNYHGGAALPNEITPHTSGLGAPLRQEEIESARRVRTPVQEVEEEVQRPAAPPLPFRSDRTGLSTSNLPPPPVRRGYQNGADEQQPAVSARPSPGLPPRLPSRRSDTTSPVNSVASPPAYEATTHNNNNNNNTPLLSLNQTAISRLGSSGVSVPDLGIGRNNSPSIESNPWKDEKSRSSNNSVTELQSRFKRMTSSEDTPTTTATTTTSTTSPPPPTQRQPPSWKQTQTSLRTAQNFHQNPNSVSLADAQQAATTAQSAHASAVDFRAKHADKFDAAEKKAHGFNKKYNVTGRLNKFLEDATEDEKAHPTQQGQQQTPQSPAPQLTHQNSYTQQPSQYQRQSPPPPITSPTIPAALSTMTGRKPPPPPPPKKPTSMQTGNHAPPPVPLGTRPSFA